MRLISTALSIAFLLFFTGSLRAQEAWSLQRCLEYAKENNIQLKQSALNKESAEYQKKQALALMFPDLNANVGYNSNFGRSIDPGTNSFVNQTVNSNNFWLGTGVTLFNGFGLMNSFRQSQLDVLAATYDVQGLSNDISMNIASAFMQVMFEEELLNVAKEKFASTKGQLERTAKLVDAGSLPAGSLMDVESQLATNELQVVNSEIAVQTAIVALKQLLNLQTSEPFAIERPTVDLPMVDISATTVTSIYEKAMENWPQIKAKETRVNSAKRGEWIAFASYTPTLRASASVSTLYSSSYKDYNLDTFEATDIPYGDQLDRNLSQSIGLSLSIPLFNGLQSRTAVNKSRLSRINSELELQDTKNQLYSSVQQAYSDASSANRGYEASLKSVTASERAFSYAEQRYAVGSLNSTEFNISRNNLAIARAELLRAKYIYMFRTKILDFYQGKPLSFSSDQ
jgi:outer membrane protein